jgi:hypothetical protein
MFFFFYVALTAEIAATAEEADCFPTTDLVVLRRVFAAPPTSEASPASPPSASSLVSLSASTDESDS